MVEFTFEQIGGRCKLVTGPAMVRCSEEEMEAWRAIREAKATEEQLKEAKRQHRLQKEKNKVRDFLAKNHFDAEDVNAPKVSMCGMMRSYPLHQAAKERDWAIINLLLK
ncbi:unnamed protein product, partial [Cladocopium goreaui]